MAGGSFNTAAFIAELGLKPVGPDEMRVRTEIQPVLIAGDLADTTPPHVTASAFFGQNVASAGGVNATMELQSLGAGGTFVDWVSINSAQLVGMRVTAAALGATAVVVPAGILSRDTPVSVVRTDALAPSVTDPAFLRATQGFAAVELFIPKGSFFSIQSFVSNTTMQVSMKIREVPAAENL